MKKPALLFFALLLISFSAMAQHEPWWKSTVFYEIYMPSFKDSNHDGKSDFKGMTSKLDYLQSLGIKGVWLTPFLKSPKVDNGYDIADYYQIDPDYGDLKDFKNFINEAHRRNIKVIMDMVINHTSTECKWFQESRKSKTNPYRDYYIWSDQPNNWDSFFGGKAWAYDSTTQQYYYHKFAKKMVDLNWANPKVKTEVAKVLRFWLELGVDGFRMDVINFLSTDPDRKDNPVKKGQQVHKFDVDQKGVKEAIGMIKSVLNEYPDKFLVGEVGSDQLKVLKQYQSPKMLDVPFNFNFGSIPHFDAHRIFRELKDMERQMPGYPTLFFGSHDMPRLMSRLANNDPDRASCLAALMLTAKGVPFIYYGEEIGMTNIIAKDTTEIRDIQAMTHYHLARSAGKNEKEAMQVANDNNRDKSRSPMQWNDFSHAGFSDHTPWIKVGQDYRHTNVAEEERNEQSLLHQYRQLLQLRSNHKALQFGEYKYLKMNADCILFSREYQGETIQAIFNFSDHAQSINIHHQKVLIGKTDLQPNTFLIIQGNKKIKFNHD
ncbi:alpha-glucosidase [Persicobacter psychrovividus]|uniref:Oligo-1,6-glucosidase n=1 Tax=Persicobacter psychrovividus TaxID=387638 RepID=A0ABN6LG83_9BACT|nr:oligo-1,6-glucosidase [Persicobacter psychrovividus]